MAHDLNKTIMAANSLCGKKQLLDPGSAVGEMIVKPTKVGDLKLASSKVVGWCGHQELIFQN